MNGINPNAESDHAVGNGETRVASTSGNGESDPKMKMLLFLILLVVLLSFFVTTFSKAKDDLCKPTT
ncbi:hypothetical protein DCAR_0207712 [Daucus carota subsp. sativus]|uniref:Transmembrane protein n=1 Tax=Daucus carota subsp. sativus TaxID=79200 RepID=A0A166E2Q9_DAUCS|nr:hypothetical protein DCAR_0207712 [Daucus carota subsp. sativus]